MRVVILTNADSIFCKEYIEHVLLGKYEVLIISNRNKKYRRYYKENGVEVLIWLPPQTLSDRFTDRIADKIRKDDIFHVHYVEPESLKYLWRAWIKCKKRILTYWGSDLLRLPIKDIRSLLPFIYTSDVITVMDENMLPKIKTIVAKFKWKNIKCLDFGNAILDDIDAISDQMSVDECKQYFGFPVDKIIVQVGYNAIREQQHLEMMREVVKLPQELLYEMFFIFHFGYNVKNLDYISQLYRLLQENNVQYTVIEKFMDKREIAILRLSADIFLYGQTTDAFAASVVEYLYSGTILIKPKWLDYSSLKDVFYYEYGKFIELAPLLEELLKNKESILRRTENNRKRIREQKSWKVLTPKWKALYRDKANVKRRRKI